MTDIIKTSEEFIANLPVVDLGVELPSSEAFLGAERVFFDFYKRILGEKTNGILNSHGFERSALYGLHSEAIKLTVIPIGINNNNKVTKVPKYRFNMYQSNIFIKGVCPFV